jgi:D-3-phosphoglycerate dehydrogenase
MFKIQTLNKISPKGLELFPRDKYEYASEIPHPDAVIVRSYKMHDMVLPPSLKAIARAGAGVNNIPVEKCSEMGIAVFNTPGANANSVKELTLAGLFLSSRNIIGGFNWAKTLVGKGDEIPKLVEKGKSNFAGQEIAGKNLGVIGLGAIGVMVANDAIALGMNVIGFDPFISVESAWGLAKEVKRARNLESLIAEADYITLHAPLTDQTKGMINESRFTLMKKGVKLINFARGGLVNNDDLIKAINAGKVSAYVTDFIDEDLLKIDSVLGIPHLGASTSEAEENCAVMAVEQIKDYLERGNIKNAVNFPDCSMPSTATTRLIIANRNMPNMVGQITTKLAKEKINIADMINKHKDMLAYNIIDIDSPIPVDLVEMIRQIDGIVMLRVIK